MKKLKFERSGRANYILHSEGFYISYNPNVADADADPLAMLANLCGTLVGLPNKGPETALVVDENYYILIGDWREQYEEIAHLGLKACMDFYIANKAKHNSPWSNDLPAPRVA